MSGSNSHRPTRSLVAVNAGLGDPSSTRLLVDRLVEAVADDLGGADLEIEVIDLRDVAVDVMRSLTTGFAVSSVAAALEKVYAADGLIVATPVFNASYSGLFKSFVDLLEVERMQGIPVLIAATGGSPRHSMVLDHAVRPLFVYLRAIVVPTGVYAAAEDWAGATGDTALLSDRIARAAHELGTAMGKSETVAAPMESDTMRAAARTKQGQRHTAFEDAGIANFARLLGEKS